MNLNEIKKLCQLQRFHWTDHAFKRMLQRGITTNEIAEAITDGEIIEEYPDDYPYPSCLLLGCSIAGRYLHVVCSINTDDNMLWIITAYIPDPTKWSADFKIRKDV